MVAFFGFQFLEPHFGSLRAPPGFRSRVGHVRATAVGEMVARMSAAVGELALFVWMALVIAFWLLILASLLK